MNFDDLILESEDQSVEISQNNAKHISNVEMYILMMDMHTLFPLIRKMISETYAFYIT